MNYTKISKHTYVSVKYIKIDVKIPGFDEYRYRCANAYRGIQNVDPNVAD